MNSIFHILFICLVFLVSRLGWADVSKSISLESAINQALHDNPALAQMQARYEALQHLPSQASSLPDPVIHLNVLNLPTDSFDIAQDGMTQIQGGISQRFPFLGKLALKHEEAEFSVKSAAMDVREMRSRLVRDVKISWWKLFYLDHAIEIIDSNLTLLRQFVDIARVKYEVGEGIQQDVLLAQLELSKLLDQKIKLTAAMQTTSARLNALMASSNNHQVSAKTKQVAETLPAVKSETELFELANHSRALLESQRQTIQAAQSRLNLAKKEMLPDFNLGVYYGGRENASNGSERSDFVSIKMSMNVPLFASGKQQQTIEQRSGELKQQRYVLQDQYQQMLADIASAYSDFDQSKQLMTLFKQGIIPQARQTVAAMLSGYQVNQVDFLNLVRSQMTLYNYEIQYWKAITEGYQALARLIAVVGREDIYE